MSDVKVTRAHRQQAAMLRCPEYEGARAPAWLDCWLDSGSAAIDFRHPEFGLLRDLQLASTAIATAEHNLRAAVIEDLKSLLAGAHKPDPYSVHVVFADSIELLIEHLEAQNA